MKRLLTTSLHIIKPELKIFNIKCVQVLIKLCKISQKGYEKKMARKIEKVFRTIFYSEIFLTPDIWQKGAYKYK